jgi:hypothetical protein
MVLHDKIRVIYPGLVDKDFSFEGSILLRNDSDGKGDYIAKWEHPTLPRPTDEQLAAVEE